MTLATGRAERLGHSRAELHNGWRTGPEYPRRVALPRANWRSADLAAAYVHATDAWAALQLPKHAQDWLADPEFFEMVVRDGAHALYRIQPAFLNLDSIYEPASFAALRAVVPPSSSVYLAPSIRPDHGLSVAATLSHAKLFGQVDVGSVHLLKPIVTAPLGPEESDFVALPARLAPSAFASQSRHPVWWNSEVAVYASTRVYRPYQRSHSPDNFSIQLSDVRAAEGRIAFTAAFTDRCRRFMEWSGLGRRRDRRFPVATPVSIWHCRIHLSLCPLV